MITLALGLDKSRSSERLYFIRWHIEFVGHQYGTWFLKPADACKFDAALRFLENVCSLDYLSVFSHALFLIGLCCYLDYAVLWGMTQCILVYCYGRFGRDCCIDARLFP